MPLKSPITCLTQPCSALLGTDRGKHLIHDVHDSFFLVNLVDHDFVAGDLFAVFDKLVAVPSAPSDTPASVLGATFTS